MVNVARQTKLAMRMCAVGRKRILHCAKTSEQWSRVANCATRASIRELLADGLLKVRDPRGGCHAGRIRGPRMSRKKKWMARVRRLRVHLKLARAKGLKSRGLPRDFRIAQAPTAGAVASASSGGAQWIRLCKSVYRDIGRGRVQTRTYMFEKLGVKYAETAKDAEEKGSP